MNLDSNVILGNWLLFVQGLGITVFVCTISVAFGFAAGILFASMVKFPSPPVRWAAGTMLVLLRGVPFIVIVFVLHFGLLSAGLQPSPMVSGIFALSLFAGAYFAEMFRGALDAIPTKQWESGQVVGISRFQTLIHIIIPQMIPPSIPATVNITIMTIKESSVISAITVGELTYQGLVVQGRTFAPFEVFATIALFYWGITFTAASLGRWADRRLGKKQGGNVRRSKLGLKFLELEAKP
ncbi:amino acid ABC transporter permease [Cognatishimia maritima]|uniref:Polar amino acid transport system permease protein n=1 Tax=Cognatishimia maritima TaxID=870908 RepID=A0A1M5QB89_9RHOB|nr:amino acid ABC transporter permease [Cognatishimia maritima]SHH11248.1 polar amino acid transport system permease protein [Cognatishimia maritima]